MGSPKPKPPQSSDQRQRFIETAKQLDCDQDEAKFKRKLGKIAKAKPADEKKG